MIDCLTSLYAAVTALLPLLLGVSALTLLAFILDAKRGEW